MVTTYVLVSPRNCASVNRAVRWGIFSSFFNQNVSTCLHLMKTFVFAVIILKNSSFLSPGAQRERVPECRGRRATHQSEGFQACKVGIAELLPSLSNCFGCATVANEGQMQYIPQWLSFVFTLPSCSMHVSTFSTTCMHACPKLFIDK